VTPESFLAEVAHPNMVAALTDPDDMRAIVNAILSLDTLAGVLHATGVAAGDHRMSGLATDDTFRDMLAGVSDSYRVLRDAAASLKHGELKHRKARLVRRAAAFQTRLNGFGLMQCGDRLGMNIVVIEIDPGPGFVRASDIVADSYRMLKRIVGGKLAGTDEHDRGTFYLRGPVAEATE
jgi:hypothetical protein